MTDRRHHWRGDRRFQEDRGGWGEVPARANPPELPPMRLAEETILLLLDEEGGGLRPVPERTLNLALAGAVLMDLQLADRIDTDLDSVILLDSTPLGDDLLDPTLADIAASDRPQDVYSWLQREAEAGSEIRESAIARLVERGILQEPQDGFLALVPGVARTRRYPHARGGGGSSSRCASCGCCSMTTFRTRTMSPSSAWPTPAACSRRF